MSKTITFSKPLDVFSDKASHNVHSKLEKEIRQHTKNLNATDEELARRVVFKCWEQTKVLYLDDEPIMTVYPLRFREEKQNDGSIRVILEQNIKHHGNNT